MRSSSQILSTVLWFAALVVGCSGGDDGAAPSSSGGTSSGGSSGAAGDGGAACELEGTTLLEDTGKNLSAPMVSAGRVAFVSTERASLAATLESISLEGGDRRTLLVETREQPLQSVWTSGETVFFLQTIDATEPVPKEVLKSIPLAGGAVSSIGTHEFEYESGRIVGVDAEWVYLLESHDGPWTVSRVARTDGRVEILNDDVLPGSGGLRQPLLRGTQLYFTAGLQSGNDIRVARYRIELTPGATATPVFPSNSDPEICLLNIAGYTVTPSRIACGYGPLASAGLDGSDVRALEGPPEGGAPARNLVVGSESETLFLLQETTRKVPGVLSAIPSLGGERRALACDLGLVSGGASPGFGAPIATEPAVVSTPTEIVWIEQELTGSAFRIRKAPLTR